MVRSGAIGTKGQSLTVLFTIAAWFCLSNHCVLGLGNAGSPPVTAVEATGCPMHSAPAKGKKPATKVPCCKDLRAVVAKSAANAMAATIRLAGLQDHTVGIFSPPLRGAIELEGFDTGPPGTFSFAESVLQQSILAHAPPLN